jgi:ADP-ribosylglycohydrolase
VPGKIADFAVTQAFGAKMCATIATNYNGDSDSTASIAGQFWEAMYGLERLPNDCVARRCFT